MPEFRFKLDSVLRYRRSRRELCLQYRAEVLSDDRELLAQRDDLLSRRESQLQELRAIGRAGKVSVDRATARRYHIGRLSGEIRAVDHRRSLVAGQIELCRKAVAQAESEVKVLEKLQAKQAALARSAELRSEARELEEIWHAVRLREVST